jgi:hypothetical protein
MSGADGKTVTPLSMLVRHRRNRNSVLYRPKWLDRGLAVYKYSQYCEDSVGMVPAFAPISRLRTADNSRMAMVAVFLLVARNMIEQAFPHDVTGRLIGRSCYTARQ